MQKKESKKSRKKVLAVILTMALSIGCIAGGAMAKYITSTQGTSTMNVAKWSFTGNGTELANTAGSTNSVTFNLFNTVNEADTTTTESSVTAGKLAPGTGGSFALALANKSDVDATYTLNFSVDNTAGIPIEYSLDKTSWSTDISSINVPATAIAKTSGTATQPVYWRWAFDGTVAGTSTDAADTALGIAAQTTAPSISVTVNGIFVQVD